MSEQNSKFPHEVVDLPSKGRFYPEASPLRSGTIDLAYMTAKHEDILTSSNLIAKGKVLDKLFDSLIVTPGVTSDDLLIGDSNAVMVASRILAYGKNYDAKIKCPKCDAVSEKEVDLTDLNIKETDEDLEIANSSIMITLPLSGVKVGIKPLTRREEKELQLELEAHKKINKEYQPEVTAFLKKIIVSFNGETDKYKISSMIDNIPASDSRYLRDMYKKVTPDVDFNFIFTCDQCSESTTVRMPIGANFFWPDIRS